MTTEQLPLEDKIQNPRPKWHASEIQNRLPWLALLLIILGQCYYLPQRLDFLRQTLSLAPITEPREIARLAYGAADYDLLAWVAQETPPETTLLLLTASPHTYGDPSYVLYHRAIYHLYPRSVWWAAPVPPTRYPAWWVDTDLSEGNILAIAQKHQASVILADGFAQPPVSGVSLAFDADTFLIFPGDSAIPSTVKAQPPQEIEAATSGQFFAALRQIRFYLQTLLAVGAIWLWGDTLYGLTIRPYLPPSRPRRLATSWLLGCGITSLSIFILLWTGLPLTISVITLSGLACLFWFFVQYKNKSLIPPAPLLLHSPAFAFPRLLASSPPLFSSSPRLLLTLLLTAQIGLVAFAAWANPLTDWDAWVNWAGKANAVFIDQTLSTNLYHNPARLPTNMDYPLMLPLVEAWFYTWLGQIHEPIIGLISFLFYVALLLLFYDAARRIVSPTAAAGFTAFLATIPRLERPAHSGLADIPLAALVFLSFLFLSELFKRLFSDAQSPLPPCPPAPLLPCSPLLLASSPLFLLPLATGLLPWLKNEGWLWLALISLSLLVGLALQVKRKRLSTGQALIFWLSYLIPALIIPLLWQAFLTLHGTYRFTFLPLTPANFWTNLPRLTPIGWNMLTRLLNPYWNFVWLLAGLTLLSRRERTLFAPLGWLVLPITAYLVLVSLSYVFSRFDPFLAHLNNSAERLILQAAPLMLWWLLGQCVAMGWIKKNPGN